MERLLISTGKTLCSMASLFTGAVVNMILDPIMIFGLLGNPAMGIAGAAYATVIAQITAAILGTVLNLTVNKEIQFSTESLRPSKKILKDIIKIGVPAIFSNAASSITVFGINWILISFTETATAAYGIYVRLQGFAMMPIYGLRNTIVSILAYNYGARLTNRIRKTIHICLITSVCITTSVMLIFLLLPNALLQLFSARENMLQIGITALRIIGISIPASGITVMLGSVFQSFGYSQKEFAVSAVRGVLLIVSAWVLSFAGSLSVVWWSFVITEITALVIAVVFWVRINNKLIKSM